MELRDRIEELFEKWKEGLLVLAVLIGFGFVINQGGATCKDVMDLIALVQERVFGAKGVRLEPEVKIIRA